jgi:hypothetical protein
MKSRKKTNTGRTTAVAIRPSRDVGCAKNERGMTLSGGTTSPASLLGPRGRFFARHGSE